MKTILKLLTILLLSSFIACSPEAETEPTVKWSIAIHGGAGNFQLTDIPATEQTLYFNKLDEALNAGAEILKKGGLSIDAVERAISILEDSPLFNAGKGSVFTHHLTNEMDASIMDGSNLNAGAVAGVRTIKNPISAARLVMEKSKHVMLSGPGADAYASLHQLEIRDTSYFKTEKRWKQIQKKLEREGKMGTVGCVAFDQHGNLAAGTSTGGMTNKQHGRIGDSPIIGCGTYANNNTCGISFTGHGEYIIRQVAAHDISALLEYTNTNLKTAMQQVIQEKLKNIKGDAGAIGIDSKGNVAMIFNTSAMFRAKTNSNNEKVIAIE